MRSDNLSRNDKDAKNYIQTVILFLSLIHI